MLVSLSKPSAVSVRARAIRCLPESSVPVPLDLMGEDVLDERLRDVLRTAAQAVSKASRSALARARELKQKAAERLKSLFRRDKKEPPKIEPKAPEARPKAPSTRDGIPKKAPDTAPGARAVIPPERHAGGAAKSPKETGQRLDAKGIPIPGPPGPEYPEPWPANLDTTSQGPPIRPKTGIPPEAVLRRLGPKGKPGKYRAAVSHSSMYKHMVRAIYQRGTQKGYKFHHSPSKSSQQIARAKMIQWGYAKRKKREGGIPDRRMIELTSKGQQRDWRRHQKEPYAVRVAKDRDYANITGRDPY